MHKTDLQRLAATINPTHFLSAAEYLGAVYQAVKASTDSYSYIQFTEDLGFGRCNALYLIIHGQRPLSKKGADKIVAVLELKGVGRQYFMKLVASQARSSSSGRDDALDDLVDLKARALPTDLDRGQLEFYKYWYHAAILEMLSLPESDDDPAWLSQHLMPSVPPQKVASSLNLLKKLGHLVYDEHKKRLMPAQTTVSTGSEVYGLAVLRYHHQMIGLAKDALTGTSPTERDISAVTIAVSPQQFAQIKAEIQALRQRLLELSASSEGADEILQVNFQMFPIGRIRPRSKRHED